MNPTHFQRMLSKWSTRCRPDFAPTAEQLEQWYVDLDGGGGTSRLRGTVPVRDVLYRTIKLACWQDHPRSAQLVAGFPGTGKSTELSQMAKRLRAERDFLVLQMSTERYNRQSKAYTREEIALVLAAGLVEAVTEALGKSPLGEESVWERLVRELQRIRVRVNVSGSFKFGPVELKALLERGEPEFLRQIHEVLRQNPDETRRMLHDLVEEVASLPELRDRQIVLLVDDLEKYRAGVTSIAEVYQQTADLFANEAALLSLPRCHVVYAVPPYLAFVTQSVDRLYGAPLRVMPAVKVAGRPPERDPYEPGIQAMEQVLRRWVDVNLLFGDQPDEALRVLAMASGGHVRDLLLITNELMVVAYLEPPPIGLNLVRLAVQNFANSRTQVFKDTASLLRQIAGGNTLKESAERKEFEALAVAMNDQLILCFQNGEPWYDIHPLIRDRVLGKGA